MERYKHHLVDTLLLICIIYSVVNKHTSIPHAIIAVALTALYGYKLYLKTLESTKSNKDLASLREEFNSRVGQIKEASDEEISKLRDEVGKVALAASRLPSSSPVRGETKIRF